MNVAHQFNSERRDLEPPIYGFLAHVMRDDYQKHRLNMFMIAKSSMIRSSIQLYRVSFVSRIKQKTNKIVAKEKNLSLEWWRLDFILWKVIWLSWNASQFFHLMQTKSWKASNVCGSRSNRTKPYIRCIRKQKLVDFIAYILWMHQLGVWMCWSTWKEMVMAGAECCRRVKSVVLHFHANQTKKKYSSSKWVEVKHITAAIACFHMLIGPCFPFEVAFAVWLDWLRTSKNGMWVFCVPFVSSCRRANKHWLEKGL